MCGIAGYWEKNKKSEGRVGDDLVRSKSTGESATQSGAESIINPMIDSLSHRGPDDKGVYVHSTSLGTGTIAIAQRRLSIIDLSPAGHQPMSNEDESIQIVFNGEIYNFLELKKNLSSKHTFKSLTDTEVIVHLYEEIGEKVFEKIHGMFALAIFDSKKNKIILGRDRMGKKPLYWGVHNDTFLFGSELKSLMLHPSFKKEIDLASLNKYFLYEYIPTPHSIFKNTFKLEAGHYLVWDGKDATKHQFWKPSFLPKSDSFSRSLKELDETLEKAVSDRLVADVPVGIFLSGGLDSSLVTYYASKISKAQNSPKIKTFSIGFTEKTFDESQYARKVAEHLGTEHHEKILSSKDCTDLIPRIGELLDEPMADASIVPTYLLSQFTKEYVTVALGGDGGDELFYGYDTFTAHKLAFIYAKIPLFLRKVFEKNALNLPTSFSNMSLDFKIKKFITGFYGEEKYRNQRWLGAFSLEDRKNLFKSAIYSSLEKKDEITHELNDIDVSLAQSGLSDLKLGSDNFYDQLGLEYEKKYMMDQVLVKVDRASMFNSLEVRAPLLDTRVVDLAHHMPADFKIKGFQKKYILKKVMEGKLPNDIIYRKKKGFGIPIAEWIRGDLKPLVLEVLGEKSLKEMNLFNTDYVKKIIEQHMNGKKDNRKQIWTLLMFSLWWRKWGRQELYE